MTAKIHSAQKVAYSSIVGQSIMLLSETGACIGQLSVIGCEDPQAMADQVVSALNAPNRHAYKVGYAAGKAWTPEREQAMRDMAADFGEEWEQDGDQA
jgi:hypothetical protein